MKMSKRIVRKFLLILSSALLLVSLTVGATVAYLTDTESVTNTFTVGNVGLTLVEYERDANGTIISTTTAGGTKDYHLLPGKTYSKEPVITINNLSEDAWVVAKVVVTAKDINKVREVVGYGEGKQLLGFGDIMSGGVFDSSISYTLNAEGTKWSSSEVVLEQVANTSDNTFYIYYQNPVSANQSKTLFTNLKARSEWTNDQITKLAGLRMEITAYAIQKEGFTSVEAAWDANKNNF